MHLLVTGAFAWTEEELQCLQNFGHKVIFMKQEKDDLPCEATWVEGVIGNGIFLYHPIENFVNLRYIQLTSAGYDRVPMDYVQAHAITVHNAKGVYSIPMAEFAVCGILQLYKQSRFFLQNQAEKKWEKCRSLLELYGKTATVVGCGSVGTACAERLTAFGCRVCGVDINTGEIASVYAEKYALSQIETALAKSDIVILSLPLGEKNRYLFDALLLSKIKKGAILVNLARGALVNTEALISALETNLGGAVLDVFEEEPLSADSLLWDMPQVILTPHNSFVGDGNHERMWTIIKNNFNEVESIWLSRN